MRFRLLRKLGGPEALPRLQPWEQMLGPPDAFLSHDFASLHPVEVDFNHQWGLTGLRFCEQNSHLTLALRWQCRKSFYGWLRCFAHVLSPSGRQISTLDHDLLAGRPPAAEWRPGDEGYEVRHLTLDGWQTPAAQLLLGQDGYRVIKQAPGIDSVRLRLGLYETRTNLRLPVVASSLPVVDECTAVTATSNRIPPEVPAFHFEPDAPAACRVVFGHALELWGWSVTRSGGGDIWVRLGWSAQETPGEPLRFFGHAIADRDPQTATLVSFDQELAVEKRGRGAEFLQDVVRMAGPQAAGATVLRAGVCTSNGLARLEIRESSLDYDAEQRCVYLPISACARAASASEGVPLQAH